MAARPWLAGSVLVLGLTACSAPAQTGAISEPSATTHAASSATAAVATATPLSTPTPVVVDATYIAFELGSIEQAIRQPSTPVSDYASLGIHEQKAYHLLAGHPDWLAAVLGGVPADVRAAVQDNMAAAQQIGTLNGVSSAIPHWKIIAPPPPDTLLAYYAEAQQAYGVSWQYLAAINLIETNMGRIQGLSSAGAQGPMQFMPATWAYYGQGSVNNPHDAILAAGRYLHAHGAPQNMSHAIYAYNPSMLYVQAVQAYAQEMFANSRTFYAYYNWQVYVPTANGDVLLPEGFSN